MKRGQTSPGFTIIETLIFLAVSSALLTSAFLLVGGSQNKTEFNQAVNDIRQQIDDVANNVATGYYSSTETTSCTVGATSLNILSSGGSRGGSEACVFIGRVIYFSTDKDFAVYNVAGAREVVGLAGKKINVTKMSDAKPTAFSPEIKEIKNSLRVAKMRAFPTSVGENTAAIGFFGTLGSASTTDPAQLQSGAQQFEIVGVPGTSLAGSLNDANLKTAVNGLATSYDTKKNPAGGVKICFDSGGTDQRAIITVGGSNRAGTTKLEIQGGKCSAATL